MSAASGSDLSAFVPTIALELASRPGSHWTSIDGSMLSADISGFTALSERLAAKGKAGAEEITELVNQCFVELIGAAYGYGGEIIKFGGDAIFVLFRGDDHLRRCADAALLMQQVLHATKAARRSNLTMSVGASHGPFDVFVAGSRVRDVLIVGPAATRVVDLEGEAASGETLVSEAIAALVPTTQHGRHHAGGIAIIGNPSQPPTATTERQRQDSDALTSFVPTSVAEQFAAFEQLGGEHRLVTVGFVAVTGVAEHLERLGPDETAVALGAFTDAVAVQCDRAGITMLHTDVAPDGLKTVLCAGAPVNTGDNDDAMLRVALEVAAIDTAFTVRQGVANGRVFAGFLGAPSRRTYTIMGDTVNTAARLLGSCEPSGVLAVDSVLAGARGDFDATPIEPFAVKGKSELLRVSRVTAARRGRRNIDSVGQMFGRDDVLERIRDALDFDVAGEHVVEIVAPAGIGKSRLISAVQASMTNSDRGEQLVRGHCTPYGAEVPYGLTTDLLRSAFGIDGDASPDAAGEQLERLTAIRAPHLLAQLPLIAVPLGAAVAPTTESEAVGAEFRRRQMHEVVLELMLAGSAPLRFIIEDLHWVDEASGELLAHLLTNAPSSGWAAVLTRRPAGRWSLPDDLVGGVRIDLAPLDVTALGRLAIDAASRPLRDAEVEAIARRADGSPLFAIELARAVSAGSLDDVPDSVERLISIRLDALEPDVRHLIRVAAVVGNRFEETVIAPVCGLDAIGSALSDARDADVILSTGPGAWQFQHALYRDVAYEGLPFRQRRALHRACGEVIEAQADSTSGVAALLSLHFSKARDARRAWEYSLEAGRTAARNYAYSDAAVVLDRAMLASRRLRSISREARVEVAIEAAEANVVIGRFDRAREILEVARRLNDSTAIEADLMRRRGEIAEREGDLRSALSWYSRAQAKIPDVTRDVDELVARSQILLAKAGLLYMRDELPESSRLSHAALADAEEAQHDPSRSQAFRRLHLAHVYMRTRYADLYGNLALVAFEELGDISSQMSVLNNFGIQRYLDDDWSAASDFYRRSADLAAKSGDAVHSGLASLNSGEVLSDQGHWERALERYADARRNFEAVGYATGAAASRLFAGIAHGRAGDLDMGRSELLDARAELERLTVSVLVDDANVRLLEIDAVAEPGAVIDQRDRIRTMTAESPEFTSRLLRAQGIAEVAHGDPTTGLSSLREALAAAASGSHDRAMVLHAMIRLFPADDLQTTWEAELSEIASRLGLAVFPALTRKAADLSRA